MSRFDGVTWQRASGCGNGSCVEIMLDGAVQKVYLRDSKHPDYPPLAFTMGEWAAFVKGVEAGEFEVPRLCGAAGPDGLLCQRSPGHPLILQGAEELHAALTGDGLMKW